MQTYSYMTSSSKPQDLFLLGCDILGTNKKNELEKYHLRFQVSESKTSWKHHDILQKFQNDEERKTCLECLKDLSECESLVKSFIEKEDKEALESLIQRININLPAELNNHREWKRYAKKAVLDDYLTKIPLGLNFKFNDQCFPASMLQDHNELKKDIKNFFAKSSTTSQDVNLFHNLCQVSMGTTRLSTRDNSSVFYTESSDPPSTFISLNIKEDDVVEDKDIFDEDEDVIPPKEIPEIQDPKGLDLLKQIKPSCCIVFLTNQVKDKDSWTIPIPEVSDSYKIFIGKARNIHKKQNKSGTKINLTASYSSPKKSNKIFSFDVTYTFPSKCQKSSIEYKSILYVKDASNDISFSRQEMEEILRRVIHVTDKGSKEDIEKYLM